jgi:N-alpha-acetyltransferase 50
MTLGVLEPYRRLRLASVLLEFVINKMAAVEYICLHVHVANTAAINFYRRFGFEIRKRYDGYYLKNQGVDPPDAYFLVKQLQNY